MSLTIANDLEKIIRCPFGTLKPSLQRLCQGFFPFEQVAIARDGDDTPPDNTALPSDNAVDLVAANPRPISNAPYQASLRALQSFNHKKRGDLTTAQQAALQVLETWDADTSGPAITNPDHDVERVRSLILAYSRIFFNASLQGANVDFQFEELSASSEGTLFGLHQHAGDRGLIIRLDPRDWSVLKGVKDHGTALLGTLFHECIHAHFTAICCDQHAVGGGRCMDANGDYLWQRGSQHPTAWFFLAAGVDIALHKLLDLDTDLSVFRSLLREYSVPTAPRLSAKEWKEFFALHNWSGVDYLLGKLRVGEVTQLGKYLQKDPEVVKLFKEEYVKEKIRPWREKEPYDLLVKQMKEEQSLQRSTEQEVDGEVGLFL